MVLFINKGIEYWDVYRKCPNFIKKYKLTNEWISIQDWKGNDYYLCVMRSVVYSFLEIMKLVSTHKFDFIENN